MKAMSEESRGLAVPEAGEGVITDTGALLVEATELEATAAKLELAATATEETATAEVAGRFNKMVVADASLEGADAEEGRDVASVAALVGEPTATGTELANAGTDTAATVTLLKPAGTPGTIVATAGEDVAAACVGEGVMVTTIVVIRVTVATLSYWEIAADGT